MLRLVKCSRCESVRLWVAPGPVGFQAWCLSCSFWFEMDDIAEPVGRQPPPDEDVLAAAA